jgi:hypothetical protein
MDRGCSTAPRYAPGEHRAWHLSILAGQGCTAWSAHDTHTGQTMALCWGPGEAPLSDPLLPTDPASVSFVSLPEWSTLVPTGALVPGDEARHLALVHGGLPAGAMRDEPLPTLGATCLYVHDDLAERAVLDRFPGARPLPMQALMVRTALGRSAAEPVLLLHRGADRLDAVLADGGRVLLSNTYPVRSAQDSLYFALLAVERTGVEPARTVLHVGGTHLIDLERDLLARYFARTEPAASDTWSGDTGGDQRVDRWFAALEQFACV